MRRACGTPYWGLISPTNKLVGYNIDRLYESWF